jgi:hypothetical protein
MTVKVQGRLLTPEHIQELRQLIEEHPDWSRCRLSQEVCRAWQWRSPTGQLQDMAARAMLLKLDQRGLLVLPPRRRVAPNRMRQKQVRPVDHSRQRIQGDLAALRPLTVHELSQWPEERPLYEFLLHEHHYLSYTSAVGLNLKYLVRDCQGRPLGCLLFGSAAWKCQARDQFIGWNPAQRQRGLQQITNNSRLLILPWIDVPCLASHILALVLRRLRADWHRKYARPLRLVETFVDSSRFVGVCYRAANWVELGQTTGRTRQDRYRRMAVAPKSVWVYPLEKDFRRHLCA